jgi:hypothetical protein
MSVLNPPKELNFYPLIVSCIVSKERASFDDIRKYVETRVGRKVGPEELFEAVSKLQDYRVLKLNEDTTGTFSLQDWEL